MNRIPDPFVMQIKARALRREELTRIACVAAIKWRSLAALLAEKASAAPTPNVPLPCQGPTPSHS
jgi:hypothetical protein